MTAETASDSKPADSRAGLLSTVKRIVVKVGSAVIAGKGKLHAKVIDDLAYDVSVLRHQGFEVVMVVSGAVAAGFSGVGYASSPTSVVGRQAAASVGQYKLMTLFAKAFRRHRVEVAQLLMMEGDISNARRFLSARHTVQELLAGGVVPIINENDPLADDEQKIGDNDHLAAWVTNLVSGDLLVLLSTVPGVYQNGGSEVIEEVSADALLDAHVTSELSESGVGGMKMKVSAARLANSWGVPAVIAKGNEPGKLGELVRGEPTGTLFCPVDDWAYGRSRWLAIQPKAQGTLHLSAQGSDAVQSGGGLMPQDVRSVVGQFGIGARVDMVDVANDLIATGMVSYSSREIERMQGKCADAFVETLGYEYVSSLIDADDLRLIESADVCVEPDEATSALGV